MRDFSIGESPTLVVLRPPYSLASRLTGSNQAVNVHPDSIGNHTRIARYDLHDVGRFELQGVHAKYKTSTKQTNPLTTGWIDLDTTFDRVTLSNDPDLRKKEWKVLTDNEQALRETAPTHVFPSMKWEDVTFGDGSFFAEFSLPLIAHHEYGIGLAVGVITPEWHGSPGKGTGPNGYNPEDSWPVAILEEWRGSDEDGWTTQRIKPPYKNCLVFLPIINKRFTADLLALRNNKTPWHKSILKKEIEKLPHPPIMFGERKKDSGFSTYIEDLLRDTPVGKPFKPVLADRLTTTRIVTSSHTANPTNSPLIERATDFDLFLLKWAAPIYSKTLLDGKSRLSKRNHKWADEQSAGTPKMCRVDNEIYSLAEFLAGKKNVKGYTRAANRVEKWASLRAAIYMWEFKTIAPYKLYTITKTTGHKLGLPFYVPKERCPVCNMRTPVDIETDECCVNHDMVETMTPSPSKRSLYNRKKKVAKELLENPPQEFIDYLKDNIFPSVDDPSIKYCIIDPSEVYGMHDPTFSDLMRRKLPFSSNIFTSSLSKLLVHTYGDVVKNFLYYVGSRKGDKVTIYVWHPTTQTPYKFEAYLLSNNAVGNDYVGVLGKCGRNETRRLQRDGHEPFRRYHFEQLKKLYLGK